MESPKINRTQLIMHLTIWAGDQETGMALLENFIKTTALEYAKDSILELKNNVLNSIEKP